jgi:predicted acylesterase/phospholipase RssA
MITPAGSIPALGAHGEGLLPPIRKRVLSLDGGGAKGVYSLGFLSHLEKEVGKPLNEHFDLIYGTSTGAIIATMISLGTPVDYIYKLYIEKIPHVLAHWFSGKRSRELRKAVTQFLGKKTFADLKKPTGIVATNWETKKPLVFKNYSEMAHAGASSFVPGYGATLVDAVCASCAAEPIFRAVPIKLVNAGDAVVPAYDGGFCANNPSLFALVDAKKLGFVLSETALFSIGVGHYPEPPVRNLHRLKIVRTS